MRSLFVTILLLILVIAAYSQDDTIRVDTNLVTLNVSVTNKQGKAVTGLSKGDFTVFDNNEKQPIDTFSEKVSSISYGIVYDLHPTTDEQTASVLAALRKFTSGIRQADDFFVTVFNEKGSLTTEFVPTEDQVRRQIGAGANSLYDAIFAASTRMLSARNHKRVLLVLTDGADHNSRHSLKEPKLRLRSVNLPVYAITFGSNDRRQYGYSDIFRNGPRQTFRIGETTAMESAVITEISKTTGGQAFEGNVRNRVYLAALCSKVADEVRSQYVLGFYPETADGKWHKLKIAVTNQKSRKLKVSNRKGYQSPGGRKAVK